MRHQSEIPLRAFKSRVEWSYLPSFTFASYIVYWLHTMRHRDVADEHLASGSGSGDTSEVATILVSNLHCSSCVRTIQDALSHLSPAPTDVHVSVVSQSVSFVSPQGLSRRAVKAALDEAGFDVIDQSTPPSTPDLPPTAIPLRLSLERGRPSPALQDRKRKKHAEQCMLCREDEHDGQILSFSRSKSSLKHFKSEYDNESTGAVHTVSLSIGGMTCASCSNTITHALKDNPDVFSVSVDLIGHSGSVVVRSVDTAPKLVEAIEDLGYEAEVVQISSKPAHTSQKPSRIKPKGKRRVALSIGGMTCASCSTSITKVLSNLSGVHDIHVDLLGNSGTVVVDDEGLIESVIDAIEDMGYEAEMVSKDSIDDTESVSQRSMRTVTLRVDGMFCRYCPERAMSRLAPFVQSNQLAVLKPLTSHTDPILEITYEPAPPFFTIRDIISALSTGSPSAVQREENTNFTVTIHKPATLEERARRMQARERRALLLRLGFSIIVAIPTFILGIVYMSLVNKHDHTRMWLMEPMWAGDASRIEWALFFLATPVYFYSAGTFHRRSLRELYALWRPGSRTPVWARFVRFGSMNLLISAGTSVAYFASIALLALGASKPRREGGETTTYFDSVVFLTMFLLIGRFLEAYSKGRTADSISALTKLRPSTALLVAPANTAVYAQRAKFVHTPSSEYTDVERAPQAVTEDQVAVEKVAAIVPLPGGFVVQRISSELLEVGDIVRIPNGTTPPADGSLAPSSSCGTLMGTFDESALTGEAKPVRKAAGDQLFLGTINIGAVVDMRVDAIGGGNMLDKVVQVVREGQAKRAPIERFADGLTAYFVPVVTALAVLTWTIWLSLGLSGTLPIDYLDIHTGGWAVWSLEFAIAVFVVACPCGIGLAAPTAFLVGTGIAAKAGVLARGGGTAFEDAAKLDILCFDKTGTITEGGTPCVTDAEFFDAGRDDAGNLRRAQLLGMVSAMETSSAHPLARALEMYCTREDAAKVPHSARVEEIPGRGLRGTFRELGCTAIIGSLTWMAENEVSPDGRVDSLVLKWQQEGKSVMLLAIAHNAPSALQAGYSVVAAFAVADPVRSQAPLAIEQIKRRGIEVWMLSGDNQVTARAVARAAGIPEANVIAEVLPHEKAEKIEWLQQTGRKRLASRIYQLFRKANRTSRCVVGFVGDGINDAPALTTADVGIAIGSGSDVAISSASFVLMSSDLCTLLVLHSLAKRVVNRVKLNFLWALVYNIVAVPVAAGAIYPAGHIRLDPVWASLAMALSSVSVVCSSLALRFNQATSA